MDFTHDDEQKALAEAVRGLLARTYGSYEDRRRTVSHEPGYDEKLWTGLAEMGVLGLPFSEADGGMGAGPIESALVAEELGRVIAPEPFLTSVVLAGGLVAAAGTDAQRAEVLGAVSAGELLLAPALAEPGRAVAASASEVTATPAGDGTDGWTLDGVKEPVPHGASAGRLVVSAALPDGGTGLFLVDGDAAGVERTGYATHDGGRAAQVRLSGAAATLLGEGGDATAAIGRVVDETRVVACHQAVGAMAVALESTTEYLRSRKQFGVPLSTFQALTFRAADMYVSLELARSLATWASMVQAADGGDAEPADAARRAALGVSRASRHVGQEAIQLHGGIAMTAEYHVGNYVSHLTALDHLFGDGHHHLRSLAADVGDHAEVDPLP